MPIPQNIYEKIKNHALGKLNARNDLRADRTHLSINTEPLNAGVKLVTGLAKSYTLPRPTVMALVDLKPHHNWGHPCEHHLYDATTGDHYDVKPAQFPPHAYFESPKAFQLVHGPVEPKAPVMPDVPQHIPQLRTAISNAPGTRHAILFSGMSNNRHLNDLEFLYRTLLDIYHFDPANITVLNYDGTVNYSGDPQPVDRWPGDNTPYRIKVNGEGSNTALAQAISKVGGLLKADDLLLIHINNHGGGQPYDPQAWICCYPDWASYTASDFGTKLHTLPKFNSLVVMMEQCHSGGFQNAVMENTTAASTSFAAACRADASSIGGASFDPFARDWIAGVTGHNPEGTPLSRIVPVPASADDAFVYADAVKDPYDSPVYADKPSQCGKSQYLTGPLSVPFSTARAAINSDGRLEVFLIGSDRSVWNVWQQVPHAGPWSGPNNLGGNVKQLCTALNNDGRLEIFGIGKDDAAYNNYQLAPHSGPWSNWNRLGGIVKDICVACNTDGRLELFGIGSDNALYNMWQTAPHSGPWSAWNRLGGFVKQVAVAVNTDGRLEVFGIGSDDALYHIWQSAAHTGPWSSWDRLGGAAKQIVPVVNSDGRLEIFAIGPDKALHNIWQTVPHGGPWSAWNSLGGIVKQIAVIRNGDGRLEVFGIGSDDAVYNIWQTKPHTGPWSSWNKLGGSIKQISAVVNSDGRAELFGIGKDNALYHNWQTVPHAAPWSGWQKLTGAGPAGVAKLDIGVGEAPTKEAGKAATPK
ncbi:hypothetical protein LPW11_18205 [Geomonas sp. RF6]|uniref:tectonin domain-containing protein n=1 Tax=Geomonas sp. RF6 TaxID=2897342 RepID=UPI001E4C5B13|nr:tectonin domain-containing protein [Geomonas sp. RF6]UFS69809.1 hypothetical protein LPW11_18205 [Geomonas sp. RF6]